MSFKVDVASTPDRDELVAEIWWNDQMVAEVRSGDEGRRFLDIYPSRSRKPWSFELEEWISAVTQASRRLG